MYGTPFLELFPRRVTCITITSLLLLEPINVGTISRQTRLWVVRTECLWTDLPARNWTSNKLSMPRWIQTWCRRGLQNVSHGSEGYHQRNKGALSYLELREWLGRYRRLSHGRSSPSSPRTWASRKNRVFWHCCRERCFLSDQLAPMVVKSRMTQEEQVRSLILSMLAIQSKAVRSCRAWSKY